MTGGFTNLALRSGSHDSGYRRDAMEMPLLMVSLTPVRYRCGPEELSIPR